MSNEKLYNKIFDMQSLAETQGWQASLQLGFSRATRQPEQRTLLTRRHHFGPLQVQRPFYPENDGTCHVYLLHPPGGIVGGDQLSFAAHLDTASQVLLTTPAATKFYRSNGAIAHQQQIITLSDQACLEWLPQETIVYDGAQVQTSTRIELSTDSFFLGWEILCLGRPAAAEVFSQGCYRQRFQVWRNGLPLFIEQGRYDDTLEVLKTPWGLQQQPVSATLVCTTTQHELVDLIRNEINISTEHELFSVSQLQEVMVCRYLGSSTERAKSLFTQVWSLVRLAEIGKPGCPPRIWYT